MADRQQQQQQQQRKPRQPQALTFLKGYVKGVSSGDTLQIVNLEEKSARAPAEYELTLGSIKAPLLALNIAANPAKSRDDEPWAFQSREFLRKKLVGQPVAFCITFTASGNRRYGIVYFHERDIREDIISSGWATVRATEEQAKSKTVQRLLELEEKAKKDNRGIHSRDTRARNVRQIVYKFDSFDVFEKLKGRHISAIVEQVRTGTTLKLYLPEGSFSLSLLLSGAQSPSYRFGNSDDEQDSFAREARFFTELLVLHRDVDVVFEGIDKSKNFFGTIICQGKNLGVALLKEGLATYVDWSGSKTSNADELRSSEKEAQGKSLRIWHQQKAPVAAVKGAPGKFRADFVAKVVDIINANTIAVVDERNTKGEELRVTFSSINPPRLLSRDKLRDPEVSENEKWEAAFAWEAREILRKKLIGQKARVVHEYSRPAAGKDGQERAFFSVYFDKRNVALDLVDKGLVRVIEHKGSDDRAADYEQLVLAESKAQKRGLGLHGSKARRAVTHFSDFTLPIDLGDDPKGATQAHVAKLQAHLPHLQRAGRSAAVIEKVFGGSRFRVWIDKESCVIPMVLSCVRTEKIDNTTGGFDDKHRARCFQLAKDQLHLRDVEVQIDSVDKRGNFVGFVWINKKDFGLSLVEEGLAAVFHPSATRTKVISHNEYAAAEKRAQTARRGLWVDFDPEVEEQRRQAQIAKRNEEREKTKGKVEILTVKVTEVIDGATFYYQIVNEENTALEQLSKEINAANLDASNADGVSYLVDDVIAAKFTGDDQWYRGRITKVNEDGSFSIYYMDHGNTETLTRDRLRPLGAEFSVKTLPPQAHEGRLAFIKVPTEEDFGHDAAAFLQEMAFGKTMIANIQHREGPVAHLVLGDPDTQVHVNAALLRAGLATLPRTRDHNPLIKKLREQEQLAKKAHLNIWQFGEYLDDEDDE